MSAEIPAPGGDAVPKRRLNPKLLVVGGGAAALVLALGAGLAWLLGSPSSAPRAKPPAASAVQALAAASSPDAAASAASPGAQPASVAKAAARPEEGAVAAGTAPAPADKEVTEPAAAVARGDDSGPVAGAPAAASGAAAPRVALPLDHLRRRIGEVLGGRGQFDAANDGELRVVARGAAVKTVAQHAAAPAHRPVAIDRPAQPAAAVHWAYEGRGGPQAWGRLKPEFATCANGQRQSPIDIRDGLALDLEPLQFDYRPGPFSVIDTGHTVQVGVPPGNVLMLGQRRFELQQFHFHRPSEERINGRQYEMDVHLVHRDAEGRLAVVAVLLERGPALPALQAVWNHLPLERNTEQAASVSLDPSQLLPTDRRYYTYMGSLTTPPCDEGVLWLVLQQPLGVAERQIDIFARLYPMNARPMQSTAGRLIKQSN